MRFAQPWDERKELPRQEDFPFPESPSAGAAVLADWLTMPSDLFEARHPLTSRPQANQLNRRVVRALLPVLQKPPREQELFDKPLELALHLPLPPTLRFYAFTATQHVAERQTDTYKIQLTHVPRLPEGTRWKFSRELGIRPILIGFVPSLSIFILWDADVNDAGDGFTYSKSVQAPPGLVYEALLIRH